jgi:predicted Mrr-cat superfamily restriction endonuclease
MKLKFYRDRVLQEIVKIDDIKKKNSILNFIDTISVKNVQEYDIAGVIQTMQELAQLENWDHETFLGALKALISGYDYSRELKFTGGRE